MHATVLVDTFVVPLQNHAYNATVLPTVKPTSYFSTSSIETTNMMNSNDNNNRSTNNYMNRKTWNNKSTFGPSQFPLLDDFVNTILAKRKGLDGCVRAWSLETDRMTYFMKDNRWCENINRSHKGNNIIWNVSLCQGTYWQSCLDPDCRFKGVEKDLPWRVKKSFNDYMIQKSVTDDKEFEHALMGLNLNNHNGSKTLTTVTGTPDSFEVDDEFTRALMELNITENNQINERIGDGKSEKHYNVEEGHNNAVVGESHNECNPNKTPTNDNENHCRKEEQEVDESFDSEFVTLLAEELAKQPTKFDNIII
jgi:hypothetical protein